MGNRERVRLGDSRAVTTRAPSSPMIDTLTNMVTGMGTDKDKSSHTRFGNIVVLPQAQLDSAYRTDWIARKIIDIPAYDATREWRNWQADADDITEIEAIERSFSIQRKVMLATQRGRLYGGGALILGVEQGAPEEELIIDKVGKDELKFVHVVNRFELSAGPIEWDILSPYYGRPQYYTRNGQGTTTGSSQIKLHPSRVIAFCGAEIPDLNQAQGWGDSILQIVQDAIMSSGTVTNSVAQLVNEAKVDIIKIPELSERITGDDYEMKLRKRFGAANTIKSVFNMLLIDKEEEWERITANFAGLPDILKMYLMIACGAADIAATRFLGQSPSGLSATGESDTRNYYDRIANDQKVDLTPRISPLDEIIIRSALGARPDDIFYEWNPLWQLSETEKADIAVKKSTVMTADVNAGLINPVVLQKGRENQLIEDGTYPGLEGFIEEFGDNVDEREPDETVDPNEGDDDPNAPPDGEDDVDESVGKNKKNAANENNPKAKKKAVGDRMASRIRVRLKDAAPRTAYVRRDLLNAGDLISWAKKAGFPSTMDADALHVTLLYSKTAFDWLAAGDSAMYGTNDDGSLTVPPGGPRMLEQFNDATVLVFANSDLAYRHCRLIEVGGTSDYEDYNPHVTFTYKGQGIDLSKIVPYSGKLEFGPEIWEEIKEGGSGDAYKDAMTIGMKKKPKAKPRVRTR